LSTCNVVGMGRLLLIFVGVALLAGVGPSAAMEAEAQTRATLIVRDSRYGRVLFDGRGFALYAFTRDRRGGPSRCYGTCAKAWPVYYPKAALRAGTGIKRSLIGTVRRRDGRRQVTYNGWPLYYYVGERTPGVILCQNVDEFGGTWLVVRASGKLVR
jgi:predicted lipoprotein with Yx(FWY)xxD motif